MSRAPMVGRVRVEACVDRPEGDPEQHHAGRECRQRGRGGLRCQRHGRQQRGHDNEQAHGQARQDARGDGARDNRGGDPEHKQKPEDADRLVEAQPHGWP